MDKNRLLELAGVKQLNEDDHTLADAQRERYDAMGPSGKDPDDDEYTLADAQRDRYADDEGNAVEDLRSWIQRAARRAHREGMSKEDFDHKILEMVDDIWSQMQTVRKRGERVGSTPRF